MASSRRSLLSAGVLFCVGLVLGGLLFAPWDVVWDKVLRMADARTSGVSLEWDAVTDAGLTRLRIRGLRASMAKGGIACSELAVRLGFSPLVRATMVTGGRALDVAVTRGGHVTVQGGVDLGRLAPRQGVAGTCDIMASLDFGGLHARPPKSGTLSISSPRLGLMGLDVEDVEGLAELADGTLNLRSFGIAKPAPVHGSGTVLLDWANLMNSRFDVSGTWSLGGAERPFNRRGSLRDLP
ncbi:MAG: hypothetical protein AB7E47_10330 [Desulfovibrionaceae bacterium]